MKPETLGALLIDRELGELSPEPAELLEAYLTAVPAARSEAEAVARTVRTARETLRHFPGLAPAASTPVFRSMPLPWLARAAALIAVAGSCAWIGYRAGVSGSSQDHPGISNSGRTVEVMASAGPTRFDGLWTQYQVAYDDQRKTFAVEKRR